jgi:hypothetical protein
MWLGLIASMCRHRDLSPLKRGDRPYVSHHKSPEVAVNKKGPSPFEPGRYLTTWQNYFFLTFAFRSGAVAP